MLVHALHRPTSTGLDPGVAVAGRLVEEASGHSVGGAIVAIDGWPLARSSRDGSFVVRHARPTWASLVARGRGLVGEAKPAGGTLVLESERARHGRIRLVGSDGEEYVRCWCNGLADIDLEGRRTTVEHVTPGRYTLEVIDEAGMSTAALTVAIREGQTSRVALD